MSIFRHSKEIVDDYRERVGLNQSSIKVLLSGGIQYFKEQFGELMKQEETLYYEEKRTLHSRTSSGYSLDWN